MTRILAVLALGLSLAGCVYAGPAPGYYSSGYHSGGYPGAPIGEAIASPGAAVD